jgi:DNA-binding NarL/FixJ family response regulator
VIEQFRHIASKPARPAEPPPAAMASTLGPEEEALNDKESRILDLIADGKSNKQIATTIFLAEGTVKNYVSRIMEKLHASSRVELALRAAARRG